jgi:hypothetical protein
MARARKLHCVCGTPVMSANDHGLEFRCDCGATMSIPYEQLFRRRAPGAFSRRASRREEIPRPQFIGTRASHSPASGAAPSLTRASERSAFSRLHEPAGRRTGFFVRRPRGHFEVSRSIARAIHGYCLCDTRDPMGLSMVHS